MQEELCKGCENACPISSLSCDKGRKLNGIEVAPYVPTESLVVKLIRLGSRAKELSDQMDEYGLEEAILLNNLSTELQMNLAKSLDELEAKWKNVF